MDLYTSKKEHEIGLEKLIFFRFIWLEFAIERRMISMSAFLWSNKIIYSQKNVVKNYCQIRDGRENISQDLNTAQ